MNSAVTARVAAVVYVGCLMIAFAMAFVVERDGDVWWSVGGLAGGCTKARLCCHGKDHECGVYEKSTNATKETKCFCDSDCLLNGDCCHDYNGYCQPVDCVVEKKWQKWNKCSVRCGLGTRNRTRKVLRFPRNGGKECGRTLQYGVCEGTTCSTGLHHRTLTVHAVKMKETEIAWILPLTFARWRTDALYNPKQSTEDSRQRPMVSYGTGKRYSAIYRLSEVVRMCNHTLENTSSPSASNWTNEMTSGKLLCVECQSMAAKTSLGGRCQGDGAVGTETRWAAMTAAGCHGKWMLLGKAKDGACLQTQKGNETLPSSSNFIFV